LTIAIVSVKALYLNPIHARGVVEGALDLSVNLPDELWKGINRDIREPGDVEVDIRRFFFPNSALT
jgi:hypothetical protein